MVKIFFPKKLYLFSECALSQLCGTLVAGGNGTSWYYIGQGNLQKLLQEEA